jgi:predicted RNA-binding protein YlxR (DUF448 family)
MSAASTVPERTCVGCREAAPKPTFLRVARSPEGAVAVDPTGRAPGRGAYLHRDPGCVGEAFRRGSIAAALRTPLGSAEAASLRQDIEEELRA